MQFLTKIVLVILLTSNFSYSQNKTKLEIINSNFSYYDASMNADVRYLVDSVIFKHEEAMMFCDSALHYFKENRFQAFGNIHINQGDTLHLHGDKLDYIGSENKAIVNGNIILQDKNVYLTTNSLHYDLYLKKASYYSGGNILNGDNKLYSLKGDYYAQTKYLLFKNDVILNNPNYITESDTLKYHTINKTAYFFGPTKIISENNFIYCENGWYNTKSDISQFNQNAYLWSGDQKLSGDSLYYNRNKGYGLAIKNVEILDTINQYIVNGEWAEYFEQQDSSIITQNTLLTLLMETDSLFLHSDTIQGTLDANKKRLLKSYNNVKFYSKDLQGKCSFLTYSLSDSIIRLFKNPVLWSSEYQLSSNYINLQLSNQSVKFLYLLENSFIISESDYSLFNQIKGKEMIGDFYNSKLKKIDVFGNGEAVYVVKDESNKITGINTVSCSGMRIDIKDKSIEKISFQKQPDATLFPYKQLPEKWKKLNGFKWRGLEKPINKNDIF